jgi:hypothetical protein
VSLTSLILQHTRAPSDPVTASMEVRDCENVNITGVQLIGARGRGIAVENSSLIRIADCTIRGSAGDAGYRAALAVDERCTDLMVCNNHLGRGSDGEFQLPRQRGTALNNISV